MLTDNNLLLEIKNLIANARETAVRSVDFQRTLLYWYIGERIFNEEQQGKERADYGNYLIKYLSEQLTPEYGSGFSFRNLNWYRQFYRTFPIVNSLRSQLSWTHYRHILNIENKHARNFYGCQCRVSGNIYVTHFVNINGFHSNSMFN